MKLAITALALALSTTGCSLVGAGIGAAIPKYANVTDLQPCVGQTTRLEGASGEVLASGKLEGYENGNVLVQDGDQRIQIPLEKVAKAKRQIGTYWELGGAIGLALDVTAAIVGAGILLSTTSHGGGSGGHNWLFPNGVGFGYGD
jgi:hypothetical protein